MSLRRPDVMSASRYCHSRSHRFPDCRPTRRSLSSTCCRNPSARRRSFQKYRPTSCLFRQPLRRYRRESICRQSSHKGCCPLSSSGTWRRKVSRRRSGAGLSTSSRRPRCSRFPTIRGTPLRRCPPSGCRAGSHRRNRPTSGSRRPPTDRRRCGGSRGRCRRPCTPSGGLGCRRTPTARC